MNSKRELRARILWGYLDELNYHRAGLKTCDNQVSAHDVP